MHDARPRWPAGAAELLKVKRQRTGESSRPMTFGRMDDHARRLVHRGQVLVFVEDLKRNLLGHWAGVLALGERDRQLFATFEALPGLRDFACNDHAAGVD